MINKNNVETQQIIVKFKSWNDRKELYEARPKKKKPSWPNCKISVDLTKRRYDLLWAARGLVDDVEGVEYAFCNVNCSLALRIVQSNCEKNGQNCAFEVKSMKLGTIVLYQMKHFNTKCCSLRRGSW